MMNEFTLTWRKS